MRTKGDDIIDIVLQALAEAMQLASREHTLHDMLSFLKDVGSEIELYLKDSVYGGAHNRWPFERLVDELAPLGVPGEVVQKLHRVRRSYNSSKHDPAYSPATAEILTLLRLAEATIREVVACGLGSTNASLPATYRRLFWLAAWDHFVGGDTEVHIMLPSEDVDLPPSIDLIYIDGTKWDQVKAGLNSVGTLQLGADSVPSRFLARCNSEDDFLAAGTFEGGYRDLLSVLAKHERVEDILIFLRREADPVSMRGAVFLAAADVAASGKVSEIEGDTVEQILIMASHRYAVPRKALLAMKYAEVAASLLIAVPSDRRLLITGPFWVGTDAMDRARPNALAFNTDVPAIVSQDLRLMVRL